jgi:hypothetical protein
LLGVGLAAMLLWPTGRASLRDLVGGLAQKKMIAVIAIYLAWIAFAVVVAHAWNFWNRTLATDTLFWVVPVGIPLLWDTASAAIKPGYYWRRMFGTLGVSALLEFYLNLSSFPLPLEVGAQVLILAFGLLAAVGQARKETASVGASLAVSSASSSSSLPWLREFSSQAV